MIAEIPRPSKCPWHTTGSIPQCGLPSAPSHLYCDSSPSSAGQDGFPLDCPLRERGQ